MEQKYYVYQHINPQTQEVFYIGMGCGNRDSDFKYGRNPYYLKYVNKHGEPIVKRIFENLTKEEASNLEKSQISKYGRKYLNEGSLTNISEGGEGGTKGRKYNMTTSHKNKISQANKGKTKHTPLSKSQISEAHKGKKKPKGFGENISKKLKGKNHTPEWNKKISESNKGRKITWNLKGIPKPKNSELKSKAIEQLDTQGNFIRLWTSMKEAGAALNIHPNGIGACCKGKINTSGGYKWKYKDEVTNNS